MIQKLIESSLQNRLAIVIGAVVLMIAGYVAFKYLKIEAYPDIADTNVVVIAPDRKSVV